MTFLTIHFCNFENILKIYKLLFGFAAYVCVRIGILNEIMCIYFMRIDAAACVRSVCLFFHVSSPPCDGAHLSSVQCTSGHSFLTWNSHSHASLWVIFHHFCLNFRTTVGIDDYACIYSFGDDATLQPFTHKSTNTEVNKIPFRLLLSLIKCKEHMHADMLKCRAIQGNSEIHLLLKFEQNVAKNHRIEKRKKMPTERWIERVSCSAGAARLMDSIFDCWLSVWCISFVIFMLL